MNLIFDKREKAEEESTEDHFQADTEPIDELNTFTPPDKTIKPKKIKKKGLPAGFIYFIFIPLIVLSLVMVYLFYFNKDTVLKYKNQMLPQAVNQDSSEMKPAIPGQEEQQPSDATETFSPGLMSKKTGNVTTRIIDAMVGNLTPELKLSTLYLDENTFSAQFRTTSLSDLENLYSKLNSLSGNITLDATPAIENSQAFLSGTYSVPQATVSGKPGKAFNKETFETEMSELVTKNNTRKIESSVGPTQSWNNITRALIFVKIEGSVSNCQQFVSDLLQSGWDLHVSKIILMPSNDRNAVLVARVFIHNPA